MKIAFAGSFAVRFTEAVQARLSIPSAVIAADESEILKHLGDADVLVSMGFTAAMAEAAPKTAASKIVQVTVYPNSALITRDVEVPAGLGSFAIAIAISAVFVTVIVLTTNVHFADIVVAFAPGAMDAMLALALTLHIDPIFVGAHHLSRFVFVSITTPGIIHLFGRPQEDVDD